MTDPVAVGAAMRRVTTIPMAGSRLVRYVFDLGLADKLRYLLVLAPMVRRYSDTCPLPGEFASMLAVLTAGAARQTTAVEYPVTETTRGLETRAEFADAGPELVAMLNRLPDADRMSFTIDLQAPTAHFAFTLAELARAAPLSVGAVKAAIAHAFMDGAGTEWIGAWNRLIDPRPGEGGIAERAADAKLKLAWLEVSEQRARVEADIMPLISLVEAAIIECQMDSKYETAWNAVRAAAGPSIATRLGVIGPHKMLFTHGSEIFSAADGLRRAQRGAARVAAHKVAADLAAAMLSHYQTEQTFHVYCVAHSPRARASVENMHHATQADSSADSGVDDPGASSACQMNAVDGAGKVSGGA